MAKQHIWHTAQEFAHLTRSEYIKLKAQRRHAALTIQMQIKVWVSA